jgi:signal transduction histidine kinase
MDELLDRAPCGFISFGDDGTVRDVNSTLLEMIGGSRETVVGRPFEALLTISSRIFYQTHFFPLLRLQGRVEELFVTLRCAASKEDVAVLVNAAARKQEGGVIYDCALMRLRERRKWEDEILRSKRAAEEANQAKSGLISMMSHDLRTPIGAIGGYCDLLMMGIRGQLNDAQLADVERIKKASEYLLGLIEDVLNFARVNAGQIENLDIKPLSTAAILTQTETLIGPRIEQAGINYRREACAESVKIVADPDRLQQILLNLLTNAVKFTATGGKVTVTCEARGDRTLIHVADTGRGIPEDQLERIFEPFVQVNSDGASKKGFGLGLAISRELARRMNGDLKAESTLGRGSTFTLTLPAPDSSSHK